MSDLSQTGLVDRKSEAATPQAIGHRSRRANSGHNDTPTALGDELKNTWRSRPSFIKTDEQIAKMEAERSKRIATTSADDAWRRFAETMPRHARHSPMCEETGGWGDAWRRIVNAPKGSLILLLGESGRGKTQLAVSLARHMIYEKNTTAMYCKANEIIDDLLDGQDCGRRVATRKQYITPGLLVIDEAHRLNTDSSSGFVLRSTEAIIDRRYDLEIPTVVIANMTRQKFGGTFGTSIVSRCHEIGLVIECDWESFRSQNRGAA